MVKPVVGYENGFILGTLSALPESVTETQKAF